MFYTLSMLFLFNDYGLWKGTILICLESNLSFIGKKPTNISVPWKRIYRFVPQPLVVGSLVWQWPLHCGRHNVWLGNLTLHIIMPSYAPNCILGPTNNCSNAVRYKAEFNYSSVGKVIKHGRMNFYTKSKMLYLISEAFHQLENITGSLTLLLLENIPVNIINKLLKKWMK